VLLADLLRSAGLARAYTVTALSAVFAAFAVQRMTGIVTYVTIIAGLVVVGLGMLVARRAEISVVRLVPLTVVAYLVWALLSVPVASSQRQSLSGWITIAALAFLAIVIAHVRDTLQTVRALGDVLRWMLGISLGVEILSGVLLDIPLTFLGVQGNLASFGPIQGIFGTRNVLGFAVTIALVTFIIEWLTTSIRPGLAIFSVVLAGVLGVLSDSPTVLVLGMAVAAAGGALLLVRRASPRRRPTLQYAFGGAVILGLALVYALRYPIIGTLGAASDFFTRTDLWRTILVYVRLRPVQGWGWHGPWAQGEIPFVNINAALSDNHASALNAYFDVLLQTGWVGLSLLVALVGVALVRSWLVASARRSVVYAWAPLVLVTLLVNSAFESFALYGFGWVVLVLCAVRAGQNRSWRELLDPRPAAPELPPAESPR
jgi:O-antigen ligase